MVGVQAFGPYEITQGGDAPTYGDRALNFDEDGGPTGIVDATDPPTARITHQVNLTQLGGSPVSVAAAMPSGHLYFDQFGVADSRIGNLDQPFSSQIAASQTALTFAATGPIRQAYVNGLIPSEQRATVLSFDALMSSTGGVVAQPALGRAADVWSFSTAYVISAAVTAMALPFYRLARREHAASDPIQST